MNWAQSIAPGLVRNSLRTITSMVVPAMCGGRVPPPCWRLQERSFIEWLVPRMVNIAQSYFMICGKQARRPIPEVPRPAFERSSSRAVLPRLDQRIAYESKHLSRQEWLCKKFAASGRVRAALLATRVIRRHHGHPGRRVVHGKQSGETMAVHSRHDNI